MTNFDNPIRGLVRIGILLWLSLVLFLIADGLDWYLGVTP